MKYDENRALLATAIPGLTAPLRGKVRDVYDLGDKLLFVATDRISAFDCVMPNGIPDKGKVLTQLSLFWFDFFADTPNHLISADVDEFPPPLSAVKEDQRDRAMLVKKLRIVPIECVVRGYLAGSGWKEYQQEGTVCGLPLRAGYTNCERLDQPVFTPTTKESSGHDMAISFTELTAKIGAELAQQLQNMALDLYLQAADYALTRDIIIADTKFEFGLDDQGVLTLADEVLTPDSSRFWPAESYQHGQNPPSLDKQFVRDWLDGIGFNHQPPAPALPDDVVAQTRAKYLAALAQLRA